MPFGSSKPAFDALEKAQSGEAWDITLVKEGEYWSWTTAKKSDGSAPVVDTPTNVTQTAPAGKVVGSNYETKEERAHRQVLIVRQSSIANAIALRKSETANVEEILEVARLFEDYVFGSQLATLPATPNLGQVIKMSNIGIATQHLMDMPDDVPL
jgi:hypothetical protein